MQKYFISNEEMNNHNIVFYAHHIAKVMRMNTGDVILVWNQGKTYESRIEAIEKERIPFSIIREVPMRTELPLTVDLIQGYAKGDKMDTIIQKTTELGLDGFYPIFMERSIVHIENDKREQKRARLEKIMLEASRQSHRDNLPQVYPIYDLKEIEYSQYDTIIVAYEEASKAGENQGFRNILSNLKIGSHILFVVGPEGGISEKEITFLKEKGAKCVGLGPRILRTETASLYMLSALSYEMELVK